MNLFDQNWQYFISRNVTVWHDSLTIRSALSNYSAYRLPNFSQIRVHRGFHSDFYVLSTGPDSHAKFIQSLRENFADREYLDFLKKMYHKNGEELLNQARDVTLTYDSIQSFFDFYAYCTCLLDITAQGSKVITDYLFTLFPDNPNAAEIIAVYGAPKSLAPIQEMERALSSVVERGLDVNSTAKDLVERFGWIPANFVGEPWDVNYFISRIQNYIPPEPIIRAVPNVELTGEQKYYLDLIGDIGVLNEYRKSIFTRVNLLIRPLFNELGNKMGLNGWKEAGLCLHQEILDFLQSGIKTLTESIRKREELCLLYGDENDEVRVLYNEDVKLFEDRFSLKSSGVNEVRGIISNKGKARGSAKIILSPADFGSFNDGDILIAKMTSVDFIPIMKKAGAFVTDEGGLASHAAIVAREYGKPCIIGTKIGTKVFQSGEMVEVDAENGIVRKLT